MPFWDRWFNKRSLKTADLPSPLAQSGIYSVSGYGSGRLQAILLGGLPGTNVDFAAEVGDMSLASVVAVCLGFYARNWTQPKLRVQRGTEFVDDHPVLALLANPMPERRVLSCDWWEWCFTDKRVLGNNYIYKVRSAGGYGPPVALQWLAGDMTAPVGDGFMNPLTNYVYRHDGRPVVLRLEDVIHAREGRDPHDSRVGRARLVSVLKEIATDNQGSTMAYAVARNKGHIGLLIGMEDAETTLAMSEAERATTERRLNEATTGDAFGSMKVFPTGYKATPMSFSPKELAFNEMRQKPEERVASIFGIPPAVVGFNVAEAATYNNSHIWRQQAWEDGIMPEQAYYAALFTQFLLPDFPETMPGDVLVWDYADVRALADDVAANRSGAASLYKAGVWDRATAKRVSGEEPLPEDEGVYCPSTASDGSVPEPAPMMPPTPGGAIPAKGARFRY